ncbi:MAG: YebC/PmpR family DNA-binding transcriptional regulator, partial [Candidatus Thiodiazotropha taylori]|nr:YebC/PmpR family DNA-binding transcriptional regulator [Candidatus Thiodiazotropha taylori]MCW4258360.1 YebC/PmpR family DNA-binding transcriptional regulator [Candidatus Thiodiazotropha taylori]
VTYVASTQAELDEGDADKLLRMIDMLEDLDDVQNVYTNAEISDEILDAVG